MASDLEVKAKEAFIDDHFELAVELYTQAIALSPKKAELYVDRAQASIKLGHYPEAVADANKAIELDPSNSRAYLRKGTACIKLEEYQTAKNALETGSALASGDSRFINLIEECKKRIAEETSDLQQEAVEKTAQTSVLPTNDVQPVDESQQVTTPAKPKFRHEFYQKPNEVVVTIFAKGIPAKNVAVDFGEQILSVSINIPGEDPYHFQTRLFAKIIREKCKFLVLSTKIEIRLAKAEQIQWTTLEFCKENAVIRRLTDPASGSQKPGYPSSKSQKVNWDKIEAEVKKEEKEEKLDGDAALNKFFRDIYQGADEDMRRAMQKSFVESNGTVLSTNWKEVGSKKVEGSPPDGMELKKWET